jgi:hypothetical protein
MSRPPYEQPQELSAVAQEFLQDAFPDALLIEPHIMGDTRDERLARAGMGLANVLFSDGNSCLATYIEQSTPVSNALCVIWMEEEVAALPAGTHAQAVDSIMNGSFHEQFSGYIL